MRLKHQVYAILRIDDFHGPDVPIEVKVTVKEIVSSREAAEREVERLNRLNGEKNCHYFWQTTRYIDLPPEDDTPTV